LRNEAIVEDGRQSVISKLVLSVLFVCSCVIDYWIMLAFLVKLKLGDRRVGDFDDACDVIVLECRWYEFNVMPW
jgi:hypothetical protein